MGTFQYETVGLEVPPLTPFSPTINVRSHTLLHDDGLLGEGAGGLANNCYPRFKPRKRLGASFEHVFPARLCSSPDRKKHVVDHLTHVRGNTQLARYRRHV